MQSRNANGSGVISIDPSQHWDGADGRWSTFYIQIGTPGQSVRLLPGTSATAADSIWSVISDGCTTVNPGLHDCADKRGGLFFRNQSTSWSTQKLSNGGLYSLSSFEEEALGMDNDNAYFGFDSVRLGLPGSSAITLSNQVVAGLATNDFFLGSLGLSPIPVNFTDLNTPIPSLLGTLREQSIVSSSSWAYTAGRYYHDPPSFGSLTFGGYDAARQGSGSIRVPFYQDISRDLLIGVQSITFDTYGSVPLLSSGIYAFMNSLVPDLWLPLEVCRRFESAFNLTWDAATSRYFVSDAAHDQLLNQKPTFTFTLGSASTGGATTTISLPYAAFDLNLTAPYVNSTTRYFPLRRAANSTQYTLGRMFFQEAYVIADYDQRAFNVSQASSSTDVQLMSLAPTYTSVAAQHEGLPTGEIVGIAIGGFVGLLALAIVSWWFCCRSRGKGANSSKDDSHPAVETERWASEADSRAYTELPSNDKHKPDQQQHKNNLGTPVHELQAEHPEMATVTSKHELQVVERPGELSSDSHRWELPS